jgi:prophage tail gpP-like protein
VEYDEDFPYYKPMVLHDNSIRDEDEAKRRARRELSQRMLAKDSFMCEAPGHGQERIFAVDTIATIIDEVSGLEDDWWIVKRTFIKSEAGTMTQLQLVPPGSLVL